MKTSLRLRLSSVAKRSFVAFGAAVLVVWVFNSNILAATPVDLYQDFETGNNGDVITTTLLNASSHGSGSWTPLSGTTWISTNHASYNLPGPVTVGGVTYNGTGGTRSYKCNDNHAVTHICCSLPGQYSNITVACYYTPGPTVRVWNGWDTIIMEGPGTWAVLTMVTPTSTCGPTIGGHSCDVNGVSTVSPTRVELVAAKTYWVNLKYDGSAGKVYVAAWDPDNSFAQVGSTTECVSIPNKVMTVPIKFGRGDNHGDNTDTTTQSYWDHICIDYTNGAFPLIPSAGTDTTPPSAPGSVRDGTGTDIAYTSSTTQLSANWDASSDAQSGISGYQYAIGTTAGGTQTVNWTSLGNVTTVTKTGLSLTSGQTYFFSVKAVNGVGLTGNATNSNGQKVDSSAPSAPGTVRDGTGTDISTTSSTTQLSANWDASADSESGISGYQYAIGTSAGGTQTVNWTSLGNVLTVTKTSLSLTVGQTYYFSVRAVNGAGLTGTATNSNGQTVVSGGSVTYFSDNFESWTAHGGAWSSINGESSTHTLNTSTDQARAGTKSLKLTDTDTTGATGAYLTKNFSPVISGDIYVRFYLFLTTGYGSTNVNRSRRMLQICCGSNRGQMSIKNDGPLMEEIGAWHGTSGSAISENAWHCIEMHVAPPSASTLLEFWTDGVANSTNLTANFSSSSTFDHITFGDIAMDAADTSTATFYMDELIVANAYIGPLDSTPPSAPPAVRDGTGADISTTTSTTQLSANWDASTDNESGISGYQYAIGTTAGGTQTVDWTSLGNVTTVTKSGLSLTVGQTYYFSVKAVNGIGLTGAATNSNGQTVVTSAVTYFSDNFENWSVHGGAWSSVNGESSSHILNTSTDQARSGSKSLKITDNDTVGTSGAYLAKNFSPAISGDIHVRFYIFFPTGWNSSNSATRKRILQAFCGSDRAQISFQNDTPVLEEIGNWTSTAGSAISENAWHCIEMHGATPSASTLMEFWVDGVKNSTTLNGAYVAGATWDSMYLGDIVAAGADTGTGSFYLDEVVVSNGLVD